MSIGPIMSGQGVSKLAHLALKKEMMVPRLRRKTQVISIL